MTVAAVTIRQNAQARVWRVYVGGKYGGLWSESKSGAEVLARQARREQKGAAPLSGSWWKINPKRKPMRSKRTGRFLARA